jgi:glycosyltransferase involved in cell wall biosynthesis
VRICLLHFSGPPTVGGVEQTLYFHARILLNLGHQPMLLVGEGEPFDENIPVQVVPEMYSKHPMALRAKASLDRGELSRTFDEVTVTLQERVGSALTGVEACIVHNALTLHKNLALTSALWNLLNHRALPPIVIGWHHDFAWARPDYASDLHPGFPWDLLRRPWPGVINVVVSRAQRERLARLYMVQPNSIHVIPPGIDPAQTGRWTETTRRLVSDLGLMRADAVLFLPARVTRRKNIRFAIEILAALRRKSDLDVRVLVSGPPGPHNPANAAYLDELLALRDRMGLAEYFHFAYQFGDDGRLLLDDDTMATLYSFCDALLFPSVDEGFGIPLLEAGLSRMPVFCSDIPPFHESGEGQVHYFNPAGSSEAAADLIAARLFSDPAWILRRRVLACCTWKRIVGDKMLPLLGR